MILKRNQYRITLNNKHSFSVVASDPDDAKRIAEVSKALVGNILLAGIVPSHQAEIIEVKFLGSIFYDA